MIIILLWHRGSTLRYSSTREASMKWSTMINSTMIKHAEISRRVWSLLETRGSINFFIIYYGASFSIKVFMWCYDFANTFGNACSPVVARSPTIHKSIGMNNTPRPKCAPIEFRHFEISGECWYRMSVSYLPERDIHFRSTNHAEIPLVHFLWP